MGQVLVGNHTHYQFVTIYSCKLQAMEQRSTQKKKARRTVFVDQLDGLNDEEDSDGGGDDGDNPMNGKVQVGSGVMGL